MTYPVRPHAYATHMMTNRSDRHSSENVPPDQILWRMKGKRRIISATLRSHGRSGYELVVAFEDNPKDIIETQLEEPAYQRLLMRAKSLKQVLLQKGLTALSIP